MDENEIKLTEEMLEIVELFLNAEEKLSNKEIVNELLKKVEKFYDI